MTTLAKVEEVVLNIIQFQGVDPVAIQSNGKTFVISRITKYSANGYIVEGDKVSSFKQVEIQSAKKGKYIMADRTKFELNEMFEYELSDEIIKKEIVAMEILKKSYERMQKEGEDIGYSLDNQEFYLENLNRYLNR